MSDSGKRSSAAQPCEPLPDRRLRRHVPAVLVGAAATLAVELGVYVAALAAGARSDGSAMVALATATVWTVLAGGPLAASATDTWGAVLRGGVIADTSLVSLLVVAVLSLVWADSQPAVTFLGAFKVYLTLCAMSLSAITAVCLFRSAAGRMTASVVWAVVLMIALASPFWISGLRSVVPPDRRQAVVSEAVLINPFYSINSSVVGGEIRVWHQYDFLYRWTQVGEYQSPPPVPWYAAAERFAAAAGILAAIAVVRHAAFRRRPALSAQQIGQ